MNKQAIAGAASFIVLMAAAAFALPGAPSQAPQVSQDDATGYHGVVTLTHERDVDADGEYEVINQQSSPNLIVDQGLNFAECGFANLNCPGTATEGDEAVFIGVSTSSTTSSADTSCPSEIGSGGLSPAQGTTATQGVGNYSVWNTFTATSSHTGVSMACLKWGTGSGTLVAENTFQSVDLLTDDKLTVNWTEVSFSDN